MRGEKIMVTHTIETKSSVQETVDQLQTRLKEKSFGVLHVYNLKEIFMSKGIEFTEYQILSVCNPRYAKEALDINLGVGAFLPCKISVYSDAGITKVALLKPSEIIDLLGDSRLNALSRDVEAILEGVVNSVK
jgi:uncharacterized protein (DUF302 family)